VLRPLKLAAGFEGVLIFNGIASDDAATARLLDVGEVFWARWEEQRFLPLPRIVVALRMILLMQTGALIGAVVCVQIVCVVQKSRIVDIVQQGALIILYNGIAYVFLKCLVL
jgi:bacteriorhodopsin